MRYNLRYASVYTSIQARLSSIALLGFNCAVDKSVGFVEAQTKAKAKEDVR
jgi:hypothetical protein